MSKLTLASVSRFRNAGPCARAMGVVGGLLVAATVQSAPGDVDALGVDPAGVSTAGFSAVLDLSRDARYAVFIASDSGLVAGDTNGELDLFVRDREAGVTRRVSVGVGGQPANGRTFGARITPDGRYVVFESTASNLVANDSTPNDGSTYAGADVFVRDLQTGVTELVSVAPNGQQPNDRSLAASISDDGRHVLFYGTGTNVTRGLFLRDRHLGTTSRIATGAQDRLLTDPALSGDGRYVAFVSGDPNLVPNDTNGVPDVYVRDRQSGAIERVSLMPDGGQSTEGGSLPALSADGRYVVFEMREGANANIFVRDRWADATRRVSVTPTGAVPNRSSSRASISDDGRFVVFESHSSNLVPGDTNANVDVFRRDLVAGVTELVSRTRDGEAASGFAGGVSPDGRFAGFYTFARIVADDTDAEADAYVYEAGGGELTQIGFTVKPAALAFGPLEVGTSRTLAFWLRNTGTRVLSMPNPWHHYFSLRGRDLSQFEVSSGCGTTLAVGQSCPIRITFRPTTVGDKVARLRVTIEGVDRTRHITGTGMAVAP